MTSKEKSPVAGERKAVFRIPTIAILGIVFLTICVTPVALSGIPGLQALYLIPLLLLAFVFRVKTVVDEEKIVAYTAFGVKQIPWSDVKGLALTPQSRVSVVLSDDSQAPLPTVRARHLPVLSIVSGGRFADPSGLTAP